MPLQEIPFLKVKTGQPRLEKRKRDNCPSPTVGPLDVAGLADHLHTNNPGILWLRYEGDPAGGDSPPDHVALAGQENAGPFVPVVSDGADLTSVESRELFRAHVAKLVPMCAEEREAVRLATVGQADNGVWLEERRGRITASLFKRAVRCRKPNSLLKEIFQYYSNNVLPKEDPSCYGKEMEPVAIRRYVETKSLYDVGVTVEPTGLHIHDKYAFLAASPDGIVREPSGTGLLEVKCPSTQKGKTPEVACTDKKFCCELVGNNVTLKKSHPYYYQVQGLLAVTGLQWCDFVVYTAHDVPGRDISVERISFNKTFWEEEMLPALLYFYERAVVPELLTRRVERLGKLHDSGPGHVPVRLYQNGYFTTNAVENSLKRLIQRIT
ncbi:hypothetical protein HPB48_007862 [Haemaphysalis longicornis]|uniref:YqaJ viral recombinase domain-containing protein n=1 Tax=Haemaphysalis longicornis TaxID=44386 RepID=A0A9J6GJ53_HAELO|nr:hypothetical protein HPB48_007862 [Haemaphysalis longicornis]